jgi:hypothetical protein
MKKLKRNKHLLGLLKTASPKLRRSLIESASADGINAIGECCLNTLNGNHKISPSVKTKLRRFKNTLRKLSCPKLSIKKKRQILKQKGGFLPVLLGSLLSGLVGSLIK